jgi:hypothetical protein
MRLVKVEHFVQGQPVKTDHLPRLLFVAGEQEFRTGLIYMFDVAITALRGSLADTT